MKVLFIYYRYPLYPQGSYFQEFLNKIAKSLRKIYLIATHYPKGNFEKPANLKIIWLKIPRIPFIGELFFMVSALSKVTFTKKLHQVDLVNSIGPRGLLAGWYLKRKHGIPLVCTIELINEKGTLANNIIYFFSRLLITNAPIDKFICWSTYYWQSHLKKWGIPGKKVIIIPAGIDIKTYNPNIDGNEIKKKYAPKVPLIVFAKPLYGPNIKAAKLLLRSVALLKSEIRINSLIGGGNGQKEVWQLAKNLGIANQLDFMPLTPFPDIPKIIAAADLVVLPFAYPATTSRSLLEALAMGKPIITTSVGEIKWMLKNKHHALLVKNQPVNLARAIETLYENKNLVKRLGHNARNLAIKQYSLDAIAKRVVACFNQVAQQML